MLFCAGMENKLAVYQRAVQKGRKAKAFQEISTSLDLHRWADRNRLPMRLEDMQHNKSYAVQMNYQDYPEVEAVALTSLTQVMWILQLVKLSGLWTLHIDGKHKLHHGSWILLTMGTHCLELRTNDACKSHSQSLVHAFRPLLYTFSKSHEDCNSLLFSFKAMEVVARMYLVTNIPPQMQQKVTRLGTGTSFLITHYDELMATIDAVSADGADRTGTDTGLLGADRVTRSYTRSTGSVAPEFATELQRVHAALRNTPITERLKQFLREAHVQLKSDSVPPGSTTMSPQDMVANLPPLLRPGAGCSDGAGGILKAFAHRWPNVPHLGCYPHIVWKYGHGRLLTKLHPLHEDIKPLLHELHTCHTVGMWDLLTECLGRLWGDKDPHLNALWTSIIAPPYDKWHLGCTKVAGVTPSQQPIEVCKCRWYVTHPD